MKLKIKEKDMTCDEKKRVIALTLDDMREKCFLMIDQCEKLMPPEMIFRAMMMTHEEVLRILFLEEMKNNGKSH